MGEIKLSGIASGIDTTALVEQLMNIERQRLANYQVNQLNYEKQTTALEELRSKISALKIAASSLSDIDTIQIFNANSSDRDILTATASSEANSGSHSVIVNQLASAETWIQNNSVFEYKTDYVGGGTFIYSYNNRQQMITTVDNETTLDDLVNLINNDDNNPGVTASLLYQGNKYHLMLSGQETGQDYQISIDASSREVWETDNTFTYSDQNAVLSTKIVDLDQFDGVLGATDKIIIGGKNHTGSTLADTELTINENTTLEHLIDAINLHFEGIATARIENGQILLVDNTDGTSDLEISLNFSGDASFNLPTMGVSTEGGSVTESLASLNSSLFIETQDASNAKIRIDGFPAGATNEVQVLSISGGVPTTGTFRLTLNGETTDAIAFNADAADIQAALLSLSGIESGDVSVTGTDMLTGDITVTFGGNLAGTDITKMTVSDDSSMDAGEISVVETTKGNDGWLHRNSNNITDALTGVTLSLNNVTEPDNPAKITITRNTAAIRNNIQSLVSAYNTLLEDIKAKTEYDDETKKMGLLSGDYASRALKTMIRGPFASIAKGFLESMDTFVQADDIGLSLNGSGELEFDSNTFDEAINDNYKSVLEILGAAKSGNSSNSAVRFYDANDKYTTAGIYHVKIEVNESREIVSAKIKLSTETQYRDAASWDGNIIYFDTRFDNTGKPSYPEHSLQLTVDLEPGVYGTDENPVFIRVKQGIFGNLEDILTNMIEAGGQFDISTTTIDEKISRIEERIEQEEIRLERVEERLTQKYARLEAILAANQQQLSTVSTMLGSY